MFNRKIPPDARCVRREGSLAAWFVAEYMPRELPEHLSTRISDLEEMVVNGQRWAKSLGLNDVMAQAHFVMLMFTLGPSFFRVEPFAELLARRDLMPMERIDAIYEVTREEAEAALSNAESLYWYPEMVGVENLPELEPDKPNPVAARYEQEISAWAPSPEEPFRTGNYSAPAAEEDLAGIEEALGVNLPDGLKHLMRAHNGVLFQDGPEFAAILPTGPTTLSLYRIHDTDSIVSLSRIWQGPSTYDEDENSLEPGMVVFGEAIDDVDRGALILDLRADGPVPGAVYFRYLTFSPTLARLTAFEALARIADSYDEMVRILQEGEVPVFW